MFMFTCIVLSKQHFEDDYVICKELVNFFSNKKRAIYFSVHSILFSSKNVAVFYFMRSPYNLLKVLK